MNHRVIMLIVVGLFMLSPIVAWLIQSGYLGWEPDVSTGKNRGELIHPARPLDINLETPEGAKIDKNAFLGRWTLLIISDGQCVNQCEENVHHIRQAWLALGKDADRVQRVLLTSTNMAKIVEQNPGAKLYAITMSSNTMLSNFPGYNNDLLTSISGRIFVIDPMANLMMQYPVQANPSDILKDMKQLLKASWIRPIKK
ncbi:MAG: hypothetical protein EP297_13005 [Gammaproteobacteria bacterium]|nr:MAG: hypothetical protein EP297_13005 [Gammaproteobacteria bacterium]